MAKPDMLNGILAVEEGTSIVDHPTRDTVAENLVEAETQYAALG